MAQHLTRLAAYLGRHASSLMAALVLLLVLAAPTAGHAAVNCTITGPSLAFGTVNPYSGFPYSTSNNMILYCTNTGSSTVYLYGCLSVGTGSGGTSATNRTLASGASTIPIQITSGNGSGQIGNGTSYPMEGVYALAPFPANSNLSLGITLAVTMPSPSSAPPPGSYTSSFSGTDAQFIYYYYSSSSPSKTCASLNAGTHVTAQGNFSISATVPTQCTVSATSMAFPTASVLANPVTATATVSTTCNTSTPVTVALDNGATGTGPTARQMRSGANAITYGIYRDAAGTMPWGNPSGTNTASVSGGTGTLTAYGLVPAQASPPPGTYTDVVNVIITY